MGSDESHFNDSLIVKDKVTRQCPKTTIFEEKGGPKRIRTEVPPAYQPNALPLGQTGSHGLRPNFLSLGDLCFKPGICPLVCIVQELYESRGGRAGLSVLTSLLISMDIKNY